MPTKIENFFTLHLIGSFLNIWFLTCFIVATDIVSPFTQSSVQWLFPWFLHLIFLSLSAFARPFPYKVEKFWFISVKSDFGNISQTNDKTQFKWQKNLTVTCFFRNFWSSFALTFIWMILRTYAYYCSWTSSKSQISSRAQCSAVQFNPRTEKPGNLIYS